MVATVEMLLYYLEIASSLSLVYEIFGEVPTSSFSELQEISPLQLGMTTRRTRSEKPLEAVANLQIRRVPRPSSKMINR